VVWHVYRYTQDDNRQGRALLEQACERDPTWALPNSWLSLTYVVGALLGWEADAAQALSKAAELAEKAARLDGHDALCRGALSLTYIWVNRARSIAEGEKAIELNPSLSMGHFGLGTSKGFAGQWQDALGPLQTARRLSPRDPLVTFILGVEALTYIMLRDYDLAIETARKAIQEQPSNVRAHHRLAAALAHVGDLDGARHALEESKRLMPDPTVAFFDATYPFDRPEDREFFFDGLRKAGWEG
jgi:tetratricopeptide (TPR) repeat protein